MLVLLGSLLLGSLLVQMGSLLVQMGSLLVLLGSLLVLVQRGSLLLALLGSGGSPHVWAFLRRLVHWSRQRGGTETWLA